MARHTVTLIPGDGVGPELSEAMRRVVDATGVDIAWEVHNAGLEVMAESGQPMPKSVLDSIRKNKVAIKGPLTTPIGKGIRSVNVSLRKDLDLYALVRPCKSYPGVRSRFENIDLVIIRENTEDLYAGIEFEEGSDDARRIIELIGELSGNAPRMDSGISIKPLSIFGTERVFRYAFRWAIANGRKKITAVHKANIMKYTDGLWLRVAERIALEFPQIEFDIIISRAAHVQTKRRLAGRTGNSPIYQ